MNTSADSITNQEAVLYILTNDTILMHVLEESPRAAELLTEYGLHCLGCYFSELDTVETGARIHGMTEDEITDMITEINQQLEQEWKVQKK